jgi:hypothetical protein
MRIFTPSNYRQPRTGSEHLSHLVAEAGNGVGNSTAASWLAEFQIRSGPVTGTDDSAKVILDRADRMRTGVGWPRRGRSHAVFACILSVVFLRRTNAGRGTQFVWHRSCLRQNGKQPKTTPPRPAFPLCSTTRSLAAEGRRDGPIRRQQSGLVRSIRAATMPQTARKKITTCRTLRTLCLLMIQNDHNMIAEVSQNAAERSQKDPVKGLFSLYLRHPLITRGAPEEASDDPQRRGMPEEDSVVG